MKIIQHPPPSFRSSPSFRFFRSSRSIRSAQSSHPSQFSQFSSLIGVFSLALALVQLLTPAPGWCEGEQIFIMGSIVRVRAEPSTQGKDVALVKFGEMLQMLAKTDKPERVGNLEDCWLQVKLDGKTGWLFGGLACLFDTGRPFDSYEKAFDKRLEIYEAGRDDALAFFKFVQEKLKAAADSDEKLFFGFYRLRALQYLVARMTRNGGNSGNGGNSRKAIMDPVVKPLADNLVFSEPAGEYFVKSDILWALHDLYKQAALSDRIARKIVDMPLPGETEGFYSAMVAREEMTYGEYLTRHPDGQFVEEVLTHLEKFFRPSVPDKISNEIEAIHGGEASALRKYLDEFKAILKKVEHPKVVDVMKAIDGNLEHLRDDK